MQADIIIGLQRGDEGKGKCTDALCRTTENGVNKYDLVLRYGGGPNAGHTIYRGEQKIVTHSVPTGVAEEIPCIIGPGCVLHIEDFYKEMEELEGTVGTDRIWDCVSIDKRVHIITDEHVAEDKAHDKIGSTGKGIMPVYRDKAARKGLRAGDVKRFQRENRLVDVFQELPQKDRILCEGAQGFYLDIDWGDYPFVSSPCLPGMVNNAGVPLKAINEVWGIAKAYETYVGEREFEPQFKAHLGGLEFCSPLHDLRRVGKEYGATTGRPRQCNWLNLDELVAAAWICSCTHLVINKLDVLEEVGVFNLFFNGKRHAFQTVQDFQMAVKGELYRMNPKLQVIWSRSPKEI